MKMKKGKRMPVTAEFDLTAVHQEADQGYDVQEPTKKKARKGGDTSKPPTSEELNNLREAETLFHSSLFRLQTEEFSKEVKIKEKWIRKFKKWYQSLRSELMDLKPGKTHQLSDTFWLEKKGVKFPIPESGTRGSQKGVFKFVPPLEVDIVGSHALGLTSKLNTTVDVALLVPKDFWQHGDYLNCNYSHKRALYLCHMCWALRKSPLVKEVHFTSHQGDHLRPALIISPGGDWKIPFRVCLLPHPPPGFFKLTRFSPSTNNVRPSWYFQDSSRFPENVATPVYNASVTFDLLLLEHSKFLQENLKEAQGVKEALALLRAWLRHRNLAEGYGSFSPFLMSMFVCYLLLCRRISWMMSSYQVIRNVFLELSNGDWSQKGLTMSKTCAENQPSIEDFHAHYQVVFVDPTGFLNLCANMNVSTIKRVQHEAQLGVDLLNSFWNDSFESLFMVPVPFSLKFDHLFCLRDVSELKQAVEVLQLEDKVMDHAGHVVAAILPRLLSILHTALGKRVSVVDHTRHPPTMWLPEESPPAEQLCSAVTFGLLLQPEFSGTAVEKGPLAENPEAVEFRSFWGEMSDLRRFQDGSIREAVLWKAQGLAEIRLIPKQIVQYILKKHCSISTIDYMGGQLDTFLEVPGPVSAQTPYGNGEEAHVSLVRSLDGLAKSLRQIKGLSLSVTSVQGISPAFRFTEVFPPLPCGYTANKESAFLFEDKCCKLKEGFKKCPSYVHPLEVVVHVEGSGKWPDCVKAVQRVKVALHLQLARVLGKELHLPTLPCTTHLDVFKDGYVFRLKLASRKELVLLKQVVSSEGTIKIKETEQYNELNLVTELLPQLSSTMHGIQQQFPVFGVTCRLAKRWVASHLLLELHLPEVCVELLVAFLFLHPAPVTPPSSPMSGLIRFLSLLSTHDWKTTPLIVNLNQDFKKEDMNEIQRHFTSQRPVLPAMFVATPLDRTSSVWTRKLPTGPVLRRLTTLAQASVQALGTILRCPEETKFQMLFTPSLDMYDVLIYLRPKQLPRSYQSVNSKFQHPREPLGEDRRGKTVFPVVGFDPVQCYLQELKICFEEFALFFYDVFGGQVIGVVWKPLAFEPKPFKVSHVKCRKEGPALTGGGKSMIPNVESILENFAILGTGLVLRIQTKTEKWAIA